MADQKQLFDGLEPMVSVQKYEVHSPSKKSSNKILIPTRYVLTLLGFLGFFNVYAMRVNLSVALVAMVKEHHVSDLSDSDVVVACRELVDDVSYINISHHNSSDKSTGEFNWDSHMQGLVLGSFFYGYVITQLPGGIFAEKYGAKWLYGIGILITSICTLLTPIAARWNVWALVVARIIEGLGEGVCYPAMNALIGRWAPKLERSLLSTVIYSGSPIGTVAALALSGVLSDSDFLGGWPSVFYVFGLIGCLWFILWILLVYESPDTHPRISQAELEYIHKGQDGIKSCCAPIPWKSILTSIPVWALVITHVGEMWGFYTLLIELPLYLSNILHFDIKQNGALSAVPNLMHCLFSIVASYMADKMRASGRVGITNIRRIFNSVGFFVPAVLVIIITFIGCNPIIINILLSLSMGFHGFVYAGCMINHVDMSPEFAGTLMGITNCISNFAGFLVPSFVGWIIQDGQTVQSWGTVFIVTAVVFIITGIIYDVFCTSELQSWGVSSQAIQNANEAKYIEMKKAPSEKCERNHIATKGPVNTSGV